MQLLQAGARGRHSQLQLTGRSVNGVRVFGPPKREALIDEFATHGVK